MKNPLGKKRLTQQDLVAQILHIPKKACFQDWSLIAYREITSEVLEYFSWQECFCIPEALYIVVPVWPPVLVNPNNVT